MQVLTWPKTREFTTLAFDATGRYLAAGGGRGNTVVWDTVTGAEHGRYPVVATLCFSPVANRLVLPTAWGLVVQELTEERAFAKFAVPHTVGALAVHPTRDHAVCYPHVTAGHSTLSAVPLDVPNPEAVWDAPIGDLPTEKGYARDLVPLGGDVFASSESVYTNHPGVRYRLVIRSWGNGRVPHSFSSDVFGSDDRLFGSRHSTTLVIQSGAWLRLQSTDAPIGPPRPVRNDGKKHFTGAAFHPSGQLLAATSNDTTVTLFDTGSLDVARTFTWDIGRLRSVAVSPDGTRAAVGSDQGTVVIWDLDF